jgi:hypothetical protein
MMFVGEASRILSRDSGTQVKLGLTSLFVPVKITRTNTLAYFPSSLVTTNKTLYCNDV